jgi:hypothetical protein
VTSRRRSSGKKARAMQTGCNTMADQFARFTPHQQREAIKRRDRGDESLAEIGRSYNVSGATISRLA